MIIPQRLIVIVYISHKFSNYTSMISCMYSKIFSYGSSPFDNDFCIGA